MHDRIILNIDSLYIVFFTFLTISYINTEMHRTLQDQRKKKMFMIQ